jgi:hypothetical protein
MTNSKSFWTKSEKYTILTYLLFILNVLFYLEICWWEGWA